MTPIEKTQAISDLLEADLPALLTTAGLTNFDIYDNKSPIKSDDLELCVYIDYDNNSTDTDTFGVVIQAQLNGKDLVQEYHSVIMLFIEEFITGDLIEMMQRNNIEADLWPMDRQSSTAFIFYSIGFETSLDDCDK